MKKSLLVVFMVMALLVAFAVTASADETATTEPKTVEVVITRSEAQQGEGDALIFADKTAALMPGDTLKVTYKLDGEWASNDLAGYTLSLKGQGVTAKSTADEAVTQISVEQKFRKNQVSEWTWTISNGKTTLSGKINVTVGEAATYTVETNNAANYAAVAGSTNEFYKVSTASDKKGGIKITAPEGYPVELDTAALAVEGANPYAIENLTGDTTVDQDMVAVIPFASLKTDAAILVKVPVIWKHATDATYYATEGKATVSFTLYGSDQNAASLALDWELGDGVPYQYTTADEATGNDSPADAVALTGGETFTLHVNSKVKSVAFTGTYEGASISGISMSGVSGNAVDFTVAAGATETITVKAASGRTLVYTIKVVADLDNAELRDLVLTGDNDVQYEAKIVGNTATVNVPSSVTQITAFQATTGDGTDVKVAASTPYELKIGTNRTHITVKALGGEEKIYYVDVVRGELPSATVSITSAPASHKGEAFEVKGTYTGEFVGLTATNATVDDTNSANGRFTATVTPAAGTTAAIKVTATAKGDGVNLAATEVTDTRRSII